MLFNYVNKFNLYDVCMMGLKDYPKDEILSNIKQYYYELNKNRDNVKINSKFTSEFLMDFLYENSTDGSINPLIKDTFDKFNDYREAIKKYDSLALNNTAPKEVFLNYLDRYVNQEFDSLIDLAAITECLIYHDSLEKDPFCKDFLFRYGLFDRFKAYLLNQLKNIDPVYYEESIDYFIKNTDVINFLNKYNIKTIKDLVNLNDRFINIILMIDPDGITNRLEFITLIKSSLIDFMKDTVVETYKYQYLEIFYKVMGLNGFQKMPFHIIAKEADMDYQVIRQRIYHYTKMYYKKLDEYKNIFIELFKYIFRNKVSKEKTDTLQIINNYINDEDAAKLLDSYLYYLRINEDITL